MDDSLRLPSCQSDHECARFLSSDPECLTLRCVGARCVPTVRDGDRDGAGAAVCVERYCADERGPCAASDCDDEDATVRPGAIEVCNGVDDDCDGRLDGPDEDDDGDGHADRCAGIAATDCDDEDPLTYVGAPELCDGVDNDCFSGGLLRSAGGRLAEPAEDRDGDERSAPDAPCAGGPFARDDCDDADASVHAGARELCDGIDNDCNGLPDDLRAGEPGTSCLPIDLSVGDAHSCIRTAELGIVCWGAADFRLAASALREESAEVAGTARLVGGHRYVDVAAGQDGTCAVLESGEVRCWGSPALVSPELPPTERDAPRLGRVLGVTGASSVAAGQNHACAVTERGVVCWGLNRNGAIDGVLGATEPVAPFLVPGTEGATQVDTTFTHSCATGNGRVVCWGDASAGALGDRPGPGRSIVEMPLIEDATQVAVGRCFTCVLLGDASVWCFGDPRYEDDATLSGPCTAPYTTLPRRVALEGAVSIDAYSVHACAALESGDVRCWGNNTTRQLGEGTPYDAAHPREGFDRPESDPTTVVGAGASTQVAVGSWHSCARGPDGAWCWGRQARHRLGNGRFGPAVLESPRAFALPVSVIRGPVQLAAGTDGTCFRMPDLSLRCVGARHGAAGERTCFATRRDAPGWETVLDVRMRGAALCAVTGRLAPDEGGIVDRAIRCEGPDTSHPYLQARREDGTMPFDGEPSSLALGQRHACALSRDGVVSCWGVHDLGQLGTESAVRDRCARPGGGADACSLEPIVVELPMPASALAAGLDHTCARLTDGSVWCWGGNDLGQLGRAPLTSVGGVAAVEGLPVDDPALSITAAGDTTCAILRSRRTWCWGGSPVRDGVSPWPRHVASVSSAEQLALFGDGSRVFGLCARLSTGIVQCVGRTTAGQLGGAAPICRGLPVSCPDLEALSRFDDVVDVVCGGTHCCATRGSGQVVCWGDRREGACGDGVAAPDAYGTASTVDLIAYDATTVPACEVP